MRWLWFGIVCMVLGVAFAVVYRRNPIAQIRREFSRIKTERLVTEGVARSGADATRKELEAIHEKTISQFDTQQRKKLARLRSDPIALCRWLTRVSSNP